MAAEVQAAHKTPPPQRSHSPKSRAASCPPSVEKATPPVDLWECDQDLRHAARLLGLKASETHVSVAKRIDPAHESVVIAHFPRLRPRARKHSPPMPLSLRMIWGVASLASWLGLVALSCGGILMGWSVWNGQEPLWAIGLRIVCGGVCALSTGALVRPASTREESEPAPTAPPAAVGRGTVRDARDSRPPAPRLAGRTA